MVTFRAVKFFKKVAKLWKHSDRQETNTFR